MDNDPNMALWLFQAEYFEIYLWNRSIRLLEENMHLFGKTLSVILCIVNISSVKTDNSNIMNLPAFDTTKEHLSKLSGNIYLVHM